jgi:hypothetical protein
MAGVAGTDYASLWNLTALATRGINAHGMHQRDLIATLAQIETNFNAILTKLDADGGVTDTNYNATYAVDLDNTVVGSLGLSQNAIVSFLDSFVAKFNSTLTKLDSDGGVQDTDYAATLAITDVVNAGTKDRNTAVDNAGMSQSALYALLNTIVTNVNALNAKLDADES